MGKNRIKILCVGEEWRGSNASGLFYALSRQGYITSIANELAYINLKGIGFLERALNKCIRTINVSGFNAYLIQITKVFDPAIILVYKGAFIKPGTIEFWKQRGIAVVNFFPDVSFMAHGKLIPKCIPMYDHIFTTKTFASRDLNHHFNYDIEKISFIPHGFDPLVHRPWNTDDEDNNFECDVSFIGGCTNSKVDHLTRLSVAIPDKKLRIWGNGWSKIDNPSELKNAIQGQSVLGDLYAYAISMSSINLALLSEKVEGASSGDLITSRTFHIPGAGGFMLHQRNDEVAKYFDEGKEMACFSSADELVDKVKYYLDHESERIAIKNNGYKRALSEHSLDRRAAMIMKILKKKGLVM